MTAVTTKNEGQWALHQREPLNHNEEFKAQDDALNVRARIEQIYSQEGFASIPGDDLRGRMRWWGLYTQRRQGIPGGRTASLPPEELDDEYFMMRVRIDGGALTTEQLGVIGAISTEFGRDTADITDRQNIQLHWVRIEDVPTIWQRLEAVGLQTTEACGDCPRVVLGSPVAGVSAEEVLDASPAIDEIIARYIGDQSISNLPRKFKTAISWLPDTVPEINDVSFVGVVHPELGPGFDVLVGGGLSTNPKFAQRLGAFVTLEEVPEVWYAVVRLFRDYGYRRLRARARLKFLVDDWGAAKVREVIENEYLGRALPDGPAAIVEETRYDHVGVHDQTDGNKYIGFAPISGRVSGDILSRVAALAEGVGSHRVRLTPHQKLLVLDVAPERVQQLITQMRAIGLEAEPSQWRRYTMACTGLEFCKLAIVDTKQRSMDLVAELEQRLGHLDLDVPVAIHLNGCPNSCARIQTADIGLKGQIVTTADGEQVEGFQVHLGGGLGLELGWGRKLRAHKVTSAELGDYVERIVGNFARERTDRERFADWVARADDEALR
ncbi:sulfite reductase (ferredoxin) [Calidifontibacter indicus]|uniref:assimilatory sulfite reductase (ferredoxin) n=1 Tax=Calidifontibacter indicus TaxID=419650 RepID=A0A3D9UXN5_9MICO|nr:sulfite reductase (ferredoxin) [Calidifontibacter indicus]